MENINKTLSVLPVGGDFLSHFGGGNKDNKPAFKGGKDWKNKPINASSKKGAGGMKKGGVRGRKGRFG